MQTIYTLVLSRTGDPPFRVDFTTEPSFTMIKLWIVLASNLYNYFAADWNVEYSCEEVGIESAKLDNARLEE